MLALNGQPLSSIYTSHEKKLGILETNERKFIQGVLAEVQLGPKRSGIDSKSPGRVYLKYANRS